MRKKKLAAGMILMGVMIIGGLICGCFAEDTSVTVYEDEEKKRILGLVRESIVDGKIKEDCGVFSYYEGGNKVEDLEEDDRVIVLRDRGLKWYLVENEEKEIKGWVEAKYLEIDEKENIKPEIMTKSDLEGFVNIKGYESDTEKLIWVDIERQRVNIFKGKKEKWKLIREFDCASGINKSPTIRGEFKTGDKGKWFYSQRLGSGAMWWTRIEGSYLFHSVAMDKNKNVTDGVVGEKRSSGCVRMKVDDARWFYENIEEGSKCVII